MGKLLTPEQREELLLDLSLEKSRRYADRVRVILLLDQGWTYKTISEALFLDEGSIANFKKRYQEGGLDRLVNDHYIGKRSRLTDDNIKLLSNELQSKIYSDAKSVIHFVTTHFEVNYTAGGMTDLLHRIGYSFKKATPVPGKAKIDDQKKFVKRYNAIKRLGKVYFSDSTHPEFAPTISYGWIRTGERFDVKTNSGWRKRVNICGAVALSSMDIIVRSYETINAKSICNLLKLIRGKNLGEEKLYLVLDGAAYNRAGKVKALAKKLKIKLMYLPPYSPNLNPIERLWKFMKKKVTANQYYEEFKDFKNALTTFFRRIGQHRAALDTLLTDNFPILGT